MYKKQTNQIMRGLSALVLSAATFCGATSADAQIVIDGHFADWDGINAATVDDAKDMADSSGDIKQIQAHVGQQSAPVDDRSRHRCPLGG